MPKGHPQPKIVLTCANALCAKLFVFKDARAHLERSHLHFCSRRCQNTTHGQAGTKRHQMWEGAKKRAKQNAVPFTLTLADIPQIPEMCPVLGIRLCPNRVAGPLDSSPSLDRLNPALGYVPGNVRVISNRANRLRGDATAVELALLAADLKLLEMGWKP